MKKDIDDSTLVATLTVGELKAILHDRPSYTAPPPQFKTEILTVTDVAEMTGYSKATLYKLISERKIPHNKAAHGGRRVFFSRSQIEGWAQSRQIKTYQEDFEEHSKQLLTNKNCNHEKTNY